MNEWTTTTSGLIVPARPKRRVNAVDLFAGCGGFSCGLHAAGVDVVAALEWEASAAITYLWNLGNRRFGSLVGYGCEGDRARLAKALEKSRRARRGFEVVPGDEGWIGMKNPNEDLGCRALFFGDAREATGENLLSMLEASGWRGTIDVVVGGPPCQGFSRSGHQDPTDPRNNLVLEFLRIADELGAGMFVIENVPPLLTEAKFEPLRLALFAKANELGYTVAADVIDAVNYNVPQFRRRALIRGDRGGRAIQLTMPETWSFVSRPGDPLPTSNKPAPETAHEDALLPLDW
ncbi:MAG: DNA cytosine methyltransferase [Patescibacteria group bacterium]|jgi:DNA (cytosine-5)-methyltransferase 1